MKEKESELPILIVGAGLAGICLAREFSKRNTAFKIIDNGNNVSSRVAAGIINPLVFRRMTRSWRVDEFLPVAVALYNELSEEWGKQYYFEMPIRRAFSHQQDADQWILKQEKEDFRPYMKILDASDADCDTVINTCGTGKVLQSGFVKTHDFLDDAHRWLKSMNALIATTFDYTSLDPETGSYEGIEYSKVIFCEGYRGIYNPWFSYLPLEATKGEILTIISNELPEDESLNRKCFILPVGNQHFKLGATYAWTSPDVELTTAAKEELRQQAVSLTKSPFEIVNHEAGVRPTTLDRRPMVGRHAVFEKLHIFNGLGAKGFLIAPLLSKEFVAYLNLESDLDNEINIKRYERLFKK